MGISFYAVAPTTFSSDVKLYVSAQQSDSPSGAYEAGLLSQQRVKSYTELANSRPVVEKVVSQLGLAEPVESLADQITASSSVDSTVLDIRVAQDSPQQAQAVAKAVSDNFIGLINEIERPGDPSTRQSVFVRVVQPATFPVAPSSTGLLACMLLGFLAGVVAGVFAAFVRNALDTTIRSSEVLEEVIKSPVLATVPTSSQMGPEGAVLTLDTRVEEHFKSLRTNLQFLEADRSVRIICVTSAGPSEGKTTTSLNLAASLSAAGFRVCLIDCDLRKPQIARSLGCEQAVGLTSILTQKVHAEQAIQRSRGINFDVVTSGVIPPNPSELLSSDRMKAAVSDMSRRYDFVLLDTPPLRPVTDAAVLAPFTDGALIVSKYGKTTRQDLAYARDALTRVGARVLGGVLSMAPNASAREAYYGSYQESNPASPDVNSPSTKVPTNLSSSDTDTLGPVRRLDVGGARPAPRPRQR